MSVPSAPDELVRVGHPNPRCVYLTDAPARTRPAQRRHTKSDENLDPSEW